MGKFMSNGENKRVAETPLKGKGYVSTVFLGIDHSHGIGDTPILFETMVFGGFLDQEIMRYETYEEALKGHEAMVILAKDSD